MTRLYHQYIIREATRLLSYLDREPYSPTYGCFDRLHWAWGAKDIANADLQKFVFPLAYLYQYNDPQNPFYKNADILAGINAAILFCTQEQARSGGFDQWLPHDNSIVSAGFVLHDLVATAELLGNQLQPKTIEALKKCALRAGKFLVHYEELHGFNSNHHLANATALLDIAAWLPDSADVFQQRAMAIIKKVISQQALSGAYYEYAGADLGYHTLGLAFMGACYQRCSKDFIFESIQRATQFSSHFLNRVSGNGGPYGTRGTHLLYPSGFEIAAQYGIHAELPALVVNIIEKQLCVTPDNTDLTNLIPLLSDYTRVCMMSCIRPKENLQTSKTALDFFCQETAVFYFHRHPGIRIHGRLNGGMIQIDSEPQDRILFASAGYMVTQSKTKGFSGVLKGQWKNNNNHHLFFETKIQKTNRMRQSVIKFIILRTLFYLFGNNLRFNLKIKKVMAWLLIFKEKYLNVDIQREFIIKKDQLEIIDTIKNHTNKKITLHHIHYGYAHFMGSARYYDHSLLKNNHELTTSDNKPQHWVLLPQQDLTISHFVPLMNEVSEHV